jgi:dolichol-phosphate mannosyltransferase
MVEGAEHEIPGGGDGIGLVHAETERGRENDSQRQRDEDERQRAPLGGPPNPREHRRRAASLPRGAGKTAGGGRVEGQAIHAGVQSNNLASGFLASGFLASGFLASGFLASGFLARGPDAGLIRGGATAGLSGAMQLAEFAPEKKARPKASALVELTLVIPTFNESANLRELIRRVEAALAGVAWEMIVVDDNSPDGTARLAKQIAQADPRVRCLRRVNRRGLAGACIEGMLASSAPIVAVMDADLQHDETILPLMLQRLRDGADLVVGSRHVEGGSAGEGFSARRAALSGFAIGLAKRALRAEFNDLMSGFFMVRREIVEACAPELAPTGFKILADLVASAPRGLRVEEVGYTFRERAAGESKFDLKVGLDFLGLMLNKASGGRIPVRFIFFALVGASGVLVHMATFLAARGAGASFLSAQSLAVMVAMTSNFFINNEITYRDAKLRGLGPLLRGLIWFYAVCAIGALANVGVAEWLHTFKPMKGFDLLDAFAGVVMGSVWNFALSSLFVWRRD